MYWGAFLQAQGSRIELPSLPVTHTLWMKCAFPQDRSSTNELFCHQSIHRSQMLGSHELGFSIGLIASAKIKTQCWQLLCNWHTPSRKRFLQDTSVLNFFLWPFSHSQWPNGTRVSSKTHVSQSCATGHSVTHKHCLKCALLQRFATVQHWAAAPPFHSPTTDAVIHYCAWW